MRLKLIKGKSYSGIVHATEAHPIIEVDDEATAMAAVDSGYFEALDVATLTQEVEPEAAEEIEAEEEPLQYGGKHLLEMNKSELETFAAYRDVPIKGCKTKADLIKALKKALPASELEGEIYYGSPTMVELQEEIF